MDRRDISRVGLAVRECGPCGAVNGASAESCYACARPFAGVRAVPYAEWAAAKRHGRGSSNGRPATLTRPAVA